jgi:putative addiction module component (TIGR02574 family)
MPVTREDVLRSAMELSDMDRLLLATELMDTVADDLPGWSIDDPKFIEELERRVNDGSPGIPWETVKAHLRADLSQ